LARVGRAARQPGDHNRAVVPVLAVKRGQVFEAEWDRRQL
jgi:hypothetical protein